MSWAYEHGLNPYDVWDDYQRRRRSYQLLMAWAVVKAEKEKQANTQPPQKGSGRLGS